MTASSLLEVAVWLAAGGVALARGPLPVRVVAAALILSLLVSLVRWGRDDPYALKPHLIVSDLATLAACLWATWRTRAAWAAAASAFQALSLLTQAAKAADPTLLSWGYITLAMVWGAGTLACALGGAFTGSRQP